MPIPFPRPRPRRAGRTAESVLRDQLRSELAGQLHMGLTRPGDRLPSIRDLARERGCDHRLVAKVCRTLEAEGLVEIRGRSGIFVSSGPELPRSTPADESIDMLSRLMTDAWRHNLGQKELTGLVSRGLDSTGLCCACVESNRDQMVAYTTEIESISGITALPFYVAPRDQHALADSRLARRLKKALGQVDLVVTTEYHLRAVRSATEGSGVPVVTVGVEPALVAAIRRHLASSTLTVIAVTAEFGDRMRLLYGEEATGPSRIRVVLASDANALRQLDPDTPVLLTRAAGELLPGLANIPMVYPHSPTLGRDTLEGLSRAIVDANLRRHPA